MAAKTGILTRLDDNWKVITLLVGILAVGVAGDRWFVTLDQRIEKLEQRIEKLSSDTAGKIAKIEERLGVLDARCACKIDGVQNSKRVILSGLRMVQNGQVITTSGWFNLQFVNGRGGLIGTSERVEQTDRLPKTLRERLSPADVAGAGVSVMVGDSEKKPLRPEGTTPVDVTERTPGYTTEIHFDLTVADEKP